MNALHQTDARRPIAVDGQSERGQELLYAPSEAIFSAAAPSMVSLGWSVFPQEAEGRRPGMVNRETIKWSEDHNLKNKLPTPEALGTWCKHCAPLNVACVFGPGSGHTFAIDIDVTDEKMSSEIAALADEILGYSPFRREGRAPKIALIYRHGPEEADVVASTSRHFAHIDEHGNASKTDQGLEILGSGKLITFHGRHHKTGSYFKWLEKTPLMSGPEEAPLVTADQVQTFLEAVDARWRFHRGSSFAATAETWQWDENAKVMVPKLALAAGGSAWVENDDGIVVDGREAYLSNLVYKLIQANVSQLDAAIAVDEEAGSKDKVNGFKGLMAETVAEQFKVRAELSGRWKESSVLREAQGKVHHLVQKHVRGDIQIRQINTRQSEGPKETFVMAKQEDEKTGGHIDPEFDFLPKERKTLDGRVEPGEDDNDSLEIPEDRSHIMSGIQTKLEASFISFFKDVYGHETENNFDLYGQDRKSRVHILIAPTGAGKTSRGIRFIAADPRTYQPFKWIDRDTGDIKGRDPHEEDDGDDKNAPLVFLLPTYQNIDELRHRSQVLGLDPNQSDEDLRKEAVDKGLIAEDELDGKLVELRRDAIACGLKTMVYSGKLRAGCMMEEKVKIAMEAGIGTAAFCKTSVKQEDGTIEDKFCEHYFECPAIKQRQEISKVHVVFLPHSFLSLTIPEELGNVRAVVADERIHHLFLHTSTFSASTLIIPRKPPRLTKKERESGMMPEDLLVERDRAAGIAIRALREGECPAQALIEYEQPNVYDEADRHPGVNFVQSALRVCGSAIQRDGNLSPDMPIEDVIALCSQPTGKDVREEWRFWKIIEERIQALYLDRYRSQAIWDTQEELAGFQGEYEMEKRLRLENRLARVTSKPTHANGAADARIQMLTDASHNGGTMETIRISWRTEPNWLGAPMLLLDASAAPPVIAKIWKLPEEDIVVHRVVDDIGKSLNVKIVGVVNQTFSNSSIIASAGASEFEKAGSARNLANVRMALSSISSLYGEGRVVAGTSIVLRQAINNGWLGPDNVDWCHFGAMRGLDMFKFHSAAFSVGRMEVPVRSIDGLVAALTYDDEVPEPPFDRMGTGMDPNDPRVGLRVPMGEQRIRLRSGHTAVVPVPIFPGKWGRLIQKQYREEELNQFVGRLRPVYRDGRTPVWFALSSVIPEDLIVDELIHIKDLLHGKTPNLWEAERYCEGIIDPDLMMTATGSAFFKNDADLIKVIASAGFDLETGEADGRMARGYSRLRWKLKTENQWRHAFVRGSISSPDIYFKNKAWGIISNQQAVEMSEIAAKKTESEKRKVRREWGTKTIRLDDISVLLLEGSVPTLARKREADKVELGIGTTDERKEKESLFLNGVGARRLEDGEAANNEGMSGLKQIAHGTNKQFTMTIPELSAFRAIEDHWENKGGAANDIKMPLVKDAPDYVSEEGDYNEYSQLGNTVADGDGPTLKVG